MNSHPDCPICHHESSHLQYAAPNETWCDWCSCFVIAEKFGIISATKSGVVTKSKMTLEGANQFLETATRWELRDHAFGDTEFGWHVDNTEIAHGYLDRNSCSVHITRYGVSFSGDDARNLKLCGTLGDVHRNDKTGPDEYVEGAIMPGLTTEAVFHELTNESQK